MSFLDMTRRYQGSVKLFTGPWHQKRDRFALLNILVLLNICKKHRYTHSYKELFDIILLRLACNYPPTQNEN
jgi:hypothetical protein